MGRHLPIYLLQFNDLPNFPPLTSREGEKEPRLRSAGCLDFARHERMGGERYFRLRGCPEGWIECRMIRSRQWTRLLHDLCVDLGHCGGRVHVSDLLPTEGELSSEEFWTIVLQAEEIDWTYSPREHEQQHLLICELFRQHFNSDRVQASEIAAARG